MIKKILKEILLDLVAKLDAGTCEMSEEEMLQAISILESSNKERGMSKEQACQYMNMSRSTFDELVRIGLLPKGEKQLGFKELSWKKSDLDKCIHENKSFYKKL